jgi:hypothetical protein
VGEAWERREKCKKFRWESPWKKVKSEVRGIYEMGSILILERLAGGCRVDSVESV